MCECIYVSECQNKNIVEYKTGSQISLESSLNSFLKINVKVNSIRNKINLIISGVT